MTATGLVWSFKHFNSLQLQPQSRPVLSSHGCGCNQFFMQMVLDLSKLTCNCCGWLATRPSTLNYQNGPWLQLNGYWCPILITITPTTTMTTSSTTTTPHLVQTEIYQCAPFFNFFFLVFLMTGHDSFNNMTHSTYMSMHHPHICSFPFPQLSTCCLHPPHLPFPLTSTLTLISQQWQLVYPPHPHHKLPLNTTTTWKCQ